MSFALTPTAVTLPSEGVASGAVVVVGVSVGDADPSVPSLARAGAAMTVRAMADIAIAEASLIGNFMQTLLSLGIWFRKTGL
jgi:hypothetical protein